MHQVSQVLCDGIAKDFLPGRKQNTMDAFNKSQADYYIEREVSRSAPGQTTMIDEVVIRRKS